MTTFKSMFLASALIVGAGSLAMAQSASTVGAGSSTPGAASGGTGGSAAAGGTSASTVGLGATSGGSSALGTGGSAAGGTRYTSSSKLHGNAKNMNGMSMARAQDKGTWSDSKTHTKIHKGEVSSRTKTMAHEPGGPPVKSTTGINTGKQ
jgi:hypothetical protein